jgi:glycosyltransferase involved in cell wall biosynthesis
MGWKTEPIVDAISATNETWRREAGREVVNHLGYVNEQEKFELYRQASCLLFPSWYEGFGLPVLEAMAAGAPVVTTARGAIAEVAGDAAMYVEPEDTEQMALAVAQCVMMPEAMGEMVAQAKNRAAEFTWERAARQTMEIIKEI